jgi:hypothetical protein
MRNFLRWLSSPGPTRPGQQPSPSLSTNPYLEKFEQAKKVLSENSISSSQLEKFIETVNSDLELNAPIKLAQEQSAFISAKAEIKAFKSATEMFKELAALDPAYCQMVDGGVTLFGPTLFSPADFFRTLEEGDIIHEVLKIYSLKGGVIPREYIYKMSGQNQIVRDANGNPVLRDEFKEYLISFDKNNN